VDVWTQWPWLDTLGTSCAICLPVVLVSAFSLQTVLFLARITVYNYFIKELYTATFSDSLGDNEIGNWVSTKDAVC
jgi:hypothetical protein